MGGAWQGMRLRVGGVLEGAGCLVGRTAIWAGGALSGWGREGAGWELEAHAGPLGGHGLGGPDMTPLSQSWAGPPQALAGQQPPPSDPDPGLRLPAGAAGGHAGALGGVGLAAPGAGGLGRVAENAVPGGRAVGLLGLGRQ